MKTIILLALVVPTFLFAQNSVTGTLTDNRGLPLPGVNIIVKGTNRGTQTDFDGNYSIACEPDDILIFSYVGFKTYEVPVTEELINSDARKKAKKKKVLPITTTAYQDAVNSLKDSIHIVPTFNGNSLVYRGAINRGYYSNRIRNISTKNDTVLLESFGPDIYYTLEYSGGSRLQFINEDQFPLVNGKFQNTTTNTIHGVNSKLTSDFWVATFSAHHRSARDLLSNAPESKLEADASFKDLKLTSFNFNGSLFYTNSNEEFANLNGLKNLALFNSYLTPSSLENTFQNNKAILESHTVLGKISFEKEISENISFSSKAWMHFSTRNEEISLDSNFLGSELPYTSAKDFSSSALGNSNQIQFNSIFISSPLSLDADFSLNTQTNTLNYQFDDTVANMLETKDLTKTTLNGLSNLELDYSTFSDMQVLLSLTNTSFLSSLQENDLWVPAAKVHFSLHNLFGYYSPFNYWGLNIGYGETISESPLLYNNYSHNSTQINAEDANLYTNRTELFATDRLALERGRYFDINTEVEVFNRSVSLSFSYKNQQQKNNIFPVFDRGSFSLQNVSNTTSQSYDLALYGNIKIGASFKLRPFTNFYSYKNIVDELLLNQNKLAIAGFNNISNTLIEGKPAGVLVGTAYKRNALGDIRKDTFGTPIVAEDQKILGDPTPNYNLKFGSEIEYKKVVLSVNFSYQNGGDLWNGTQQFINQEKPGLIIAEAAITDASYLNFNECSIGYEWTDPHENTSLRSFIRSYKMSLYANNLRTWGNANMTAPDSTLFDTNTAQGLQFFNQPQRTEIGVTLTAKI